MQKLNGKILLHVGAIQDSNTSCCTFWKGKIRDGTLDYLSRTTQALVLEFKEGVGKDQNNLLR